MYNLDMAVASFWQLARHWKQGDKAKLELSCEDGSLHMQLSAVLGRPDLPHFPPPSPPCPHSSPPAPQKKKFPSQPLRQEHCQQEARTKADEADPKTQNNDGTEKNLYDGVTNDKLAEVIVEAAAEIPEIHKCIRKGAQPTQDNEAPDIPVGWDG